MVPLFLTLPRAWHGLSLCEQVQHSPLLIFCLTQTAYPVSIWFYSYTSLSPKKNSWLSIMVTIISSSNFEAKVIVSKDVNSGRSTVGHQQMAKFLLSILFSTECLVTLQKRRKEFYFTKHDQTRIIFNSLDLWA